MGMSNDGGGGGATKKRGGGEGGTPWFWFWRQNAQTTLGGNPKPTCALSHLPPWSYVLLLFSTEGKYRQRRISRVL